MRRAKNTLCLLVAAVAFIACNETAEPRNEQRAERKDNLSRIDLPEIRERGKLVLLTENSSTSYYLYRGQGMGFDYELVKAFAREHDLDLEVRILEDLNDMFDLLRDGKGDLIACNLAVRSERDALANFTSPLTETRQVLVQRKPEKLANISAKALDDTLIRTWEELEGHEIYVHEYSSFHQNLKSRLAKDSIGVELIEASGNIDTEQLIRLVAEGQIDLTVADENVALLNQTYYPELDVSYALSEEEPIAWAVRKDADSLLTTLNTWIAEKRTRRRVAYTYKKYFEASKDQHARVKSPFSSLSGKRISEFDPVIQQYSGRIEWDWKLLAAMIYQESRFNPEARSWAGAFGLMQLMPLTARRFGIDTTDTREQNIRAGVDYIKYLDNFWRNRIHDPQERIKFILASYNVGPGHVQDAQRIAQYLGKNPYIWDNNVAEGLLLKSDQTYLALDGVKHGYCRGKEPYDYVKKVMTQYTMYQTMDL